MTASYLNRYLEELSAETSFGTSSEMNKKTVLSFTEVWENLEDVSSSDSAKIIDTGL
jgi:hypothetical protein